MNKAKWQMANQDQAGEGSAPNLKVVDNTPNDAQLEYVLDIPLRVSVELGRTKILVQDLIKLHKGSVI